MNIARIAWVIGALGLAGSLIGAVVDPGAFAFGWLAALTVWMRWPLGCLALLLVHALTGGRWGLVIRGQLASGIGMLLLLIPAMIPPLLLLPHLYPWAHHDVAQHLANSFYLNLPFAGLRWIFYLIVWFGTGALALGRLRKGRPLVPLAAPALILVGFTVNFAAIDAIMSLDPHFNSSDFGMTYAAESGLFALSVTILTTLLRQPVDMTERNDLGRLLQGLLILWAYLDFMQLLIVWQSNLPNEAAWYLARTAGGWRFVATAIAVVHFALPFFGLMMPALRRSVRGLIATTTLLIVMSALRGWWLVLPAGGRSVGWVDVACMAAFAGISIGLLLTPAFAAHVTPAQVRHA